MCKEFKRTKIALTIALALALMLCAGCVTKITNTQGELPTAKYEVTFWQVRDVDEPQGAARIAQEMEPAAADAEAEAEAVEQEYAEYYEESYYEPTYYDNGDNFAFEGVREYNGRTETWYSSNQLYHYRTGEWTVDDEGYYRDSEGRYVVAASDVPEDTEIETSKGTGIVLDSGCDEGVTDFYVNF